MTVKNVNKTIVNCLQSILDQSFNEFEIIVIDDFSTDNTKQLIQSLNDKRIKCFSNDRWLGITASRNKGITKASGKYVFFTDGDCIVTNNWIEEGLKYLQRSNCVAVEGRIYYVSKSYRPSFSDHVMENRSGGHFMTGNMAYNKAALEKVGGFDEKLSYLEDRDIAYRLMEIGKIYFNKEMVVYHPQVTITPYKLVTSASNVKNRVYLYRKLHVKDFLLGRILYPMNLMKLIFPPLIFSSLFFKRFKDSNDFKLFPFSYVHLAYQRLQIWEECAKEKVFLI